MRFTRPTVVFVSAAIAIGAFAAPATAETVRCQNTTLSGGVVNGELRVPADSVCVLEDLTVNGDVFVAPDADLYATDVTVTGDVNARPGAFAELEDTVVEGSLLSARAFGVLLQDSEVLLDVESRQAESLFVFESSIGAGLDIRGGADRVTEAFVDNSNVFGNFVSRASHLTDIYNTVISGDVDVRNTAQGSIVLSVDVDGDAIFANHRGSLEIGGVGAEVNYFGSDLVLNNNNIEATVEGNIVRGDVSCSGNLEVPVLNDNRVRGDLLGQCADAEIQTASVQAFSAAAADENDRLEDALEAVEARRAAAGQ